MTAWLAQVCRSAWKLTGGSILACMTRLRRRAELVGGTPRLAIGFAQHVSLPARPAVSCGKRHALIGQHDMADLARSWT